MELNAQNQLISSYIFLRLAGIFLIVRVMLMPPTRVVFISFFSPPFLIVSAVLLMIFFVKINTLGTSKTSHIITAQVFVSIWTVLVVLGVYSIFFYRVNYIRYLIFGFAIAITQFIGFFFTNKIINELDVLSSQFAKIKSVSILSFASYGLIEIIPNLIFRVTGSYIPRPISILILFFHFLFSVGVGIVFIIISIKIVRSREMLTTSVVSIQARSEVISTKVPPKQFCSNCGSGRKEEDKFCQSCGHSLK